MFKINKLSLKVDDVHEIITRKSMLSLTVVVLRSGSGDEELGGPPAGMHPKHLRIAATMASTCRRQEIRKSEPLLFSCKSLSPFFLAGFSIATPPASISSLPLYFTL